VSGTIVPVSRDVVVNAADDPSQKKK